jgi:hypothetical protein
MRCIAEPHCKHILCSDAWGASEVSNALTVCGVDLSKVCLFRIVVIAAQQAAQPAASFVELRFHSIAFRRASTVPFCTLFLTAAVRLEITSTVNCAERGPPNAYTFRLSILPVPCTYSVPIAFPS